MYFCVFSYNRGQLLKNCVESIERCAESPTIFIFDDNSQDPETLAILDEIKVKHKIIKPDLDNFHMHKCGGLYNNMQMAFDYIPDGELAFFAQDDSQLVRKILKKDIEDINNFFEVNPKSAFLNYTFLKGKLRSRDEESTYFDKDSNAYFRKDNAQQSAGIYFSAIAIAHIDRLKSNFWQFLSREKHNNSQAKDLFGKMGFIKNPFLMQLPSAPAYRGKTKTWGLKMAEDYNECGFHPLSYMSDTENDLFVNRSAKKLPVAEDFLKLKHKELRKPWAINPFQGTKFLKPLHKIELTVRNWFK
ncbi:hypothetical protein [Thalassomonas sp. M1454]|uniref:hypothetical protein n=1 Tax=Thalassomonas sp. M1454 TaxID=2594477 RepID=UPI00117D5346|nr:hypothetical protein [Thalassomonas sp. M1454]TRX58158.1 hypothetical protein FNN08_01845 [Thalassomonas sp. M1454]